MEVNIEVPTNMDLEKVSNFFSVFRFPNMSVHPKDTKESAIQVDVANEDFCITVLDGEEHIKAKDIEAMLDNGSCSLLIFNQDAKNLDEPKVIFATDHSEQAALNLEKFKALKPSGFAGATVISEANASGSEVVNHELSNKFLERTKYAVQSTQANVIIANFDLTNLRRKSAQLTNIMKLVLQNRCHVLILKSY
jgi:hypothetical protein